MSGDYTRRRENDDAVDQEVKKLMSKGMDEIPPKELERLRSQYNSSTIADRIFDAFYDRRDKIHKTAKQFAKLILEKYGSERYPLHKLLHKALKFKAHYGLSDAEFTEFKRIYEQTVAGTYDRHRRSEPLPRTNIGKALGTVAFGATTEPMEVADNEYAIIEKILQQYAATRTLHSQVVLQALAYDDGLFPSTINGGTVAVGNNQMFGSTYDQRRDNPNIHVHPVLVALFGPRIGLFDECILFANLGYIVKTRYQKEQILTKPDYELYFNLVSDPNDVVCDSSAVKDLHDRFELQKNIWNSVFALRAGKIYEPTTAGFLTAVDNCRVNRYDAPDLVYVGDEGTVLRRILASFAIRPTVVATTPLYNLMNRNPFQTSVVMPKVASLPMIVYRLPFSGVKNAFELSHSLESALEQSQWFLEEDNTIIPKHQSIIYTRRVLVFFVNRRQQNITFSRLNQPFNYNTLPNTMNGYENVNTTPVDFKFVMDNVGSRTGKAGVDNLYLRSVVTIDQLRTQTDGKHIVGGASTFLMQYKKDGASSATAPVPDNAPVNILRYNPRNPLRRNATVIPDTATPAYLENGTTSAGVSTKPDDPAAWTVYKSTSSGGTSTPHAEVTKYLRTNGTIFVYAKIAQPDVSSD